MQPIDLRTLTEGSKVSGLILVQSHSQKPANSISRAPVNGTAYYKGKTMTFKMWDAKLQSIFNSNDLTGSILLVAADVGTYNGKLEMTLTDILFDHGVTDSSIFYKSVDVDAVFSQFVDFVNTNLSQQAVAVLLHIFKTENLFEPFKTTWAGSVIHDAQVGGLMNHTLKLLRLAKTLIENDPRLQPWADLIYLSMIFHDIGKIHELGEGGVYTPNSFVTHRTMGVEIVSKYKNEICAAFNETFYYHILAIIQQHHGKEHGDPPTTVWSEIIHILDLLESTATSVMDKLETGDYQTRNGQKVMWIHGTNLVI